MKEWQDEYQLKASQLTRDPRPGPGPGPIMRKKKVPGRAQLHPIHFTSLQFISFQFSSFEFIYTHESLATEPEPEPEPDPDSDPSHPIQFISITGPIRSNFSQKEEGILVFLSSPPTTPTLPSKPTGWNRDPPAGQPASVVVSVVVVVIIVIHPEAASYASQPAPLRSALTASPPASSRSRS